MVTGRQDRRPQRRTSSSADRGRSPARPRTFTIDRSVWRPPHITCVSAASSSPQRPETVVVALPRCRAFTIRRPSSPEGPRIDTSIARQPRELGPSSETRRFPILRRLIRRAHASQRPLLSSGRRCCVGTVIRHRAYTALGFLTILTGDKCARRTRRLDAFAYIELGDKATATWFSGARSEPISEQPRTFRLELPFTCSPSDERA